MKLLDFQHQLIEVEITNRESCLSPTLHWIIQSPDGERINIAPCNAGPSNKSWRIVIMNTPVADMWSREFLRVLEEEQQLIFAALMKGSQNWTEESWTKVPWYKRMFGARSTYIPPVWIGPRRPDGKPDYPDRINTYRNGTT